MDKITNKLAECQIVYIFEGAGTLETDKLTIRVHAGDAMLLSPNQWHRYKPDDATGWHEYWVGFSGESIKRIFSAGFFSRKSPVTHIREEKIMLTTFGHLFQNAKENTPALQQVMLAAPAFFFRSSAPQGSHSLLPRRAPARWSNACAR
ncbi:AraC family ligand binding domain-containing protein [Edaphobacter dinghuensis]|uniref:AraC family ligand binding domain-containing protein n=1 Tax=Edaphobacter dinghuensis TaxID=1560005 RepID=UPI001668E169|nr:AraC family ligand binding domain-containing protein [Edaphobacter dinghuensis]